MPDLEPICLHLEACIRRVRKILPVINRDEFLSVVAAIREAAEQQQSNRAQGIE
jgi:hypothetical protein